MIKDEKIIDAIERGDIEVGNFWIETWRGCPFNCEHCYHGPSQNYAMTQDTMDTVLDNFDNKPIYDLRLTGGELSSNLESLEKFTQTLDKKKTKFNYVSFVTNGWNMSNDFFEITDRMAQLSQKKTAFIQMSNDFAHKDEYKRLGLDYEKQLAKFLEAGNRFPHIETDGRIYQSKEQMDIKNFGNAKELKGFKSNVVRQNDLYLTFGRSFFKSGAAILQSINFDAKGNVTLPVIEYTAGDENNFGNVHKDNLTDIYINHGQEEKFI